METHHQGLPVLHALSQHLKQSARPQRDCPVCLVMENADPKGALSCSQPGMRLAGTTVSSHGHMGWEGGQDCTIGVLLKGRLGLGYTAKNHIIGIFLLHQFLFLEDLDISDFLCQVFMMLLRES